MLATCRALQDLQDAPNVLVAQAQLLCAREGDARCPTTALGVGELTRSQWSAHTAKRPDPQARGRTGDDDRDVRDGTYPVPGPGSRTR